MDDHWFFRLLWRVNAVSLAALLAIGLVIVIWTFGSEVLWKTRQVTGVVNVDPEDRSLVETRRIVMAGPIAGQGLFQVHLVSDQEYDSGYSSKGSHNSKLNTGVYDPATGQMRWLFSGNDQLITEVTPLFAADAEAGRGAYSPSDRDVIGQLISFADQDTSGDNRLSFSDDKTVLATRADGQAGKVILTGIKGDLRVWPLAPQQVLLTFRDALGHQAAIYDVAQMRLGEIRQISQP